MLDQQQLATFDSFAHGQHIIAGCIARRESNARHAAFTARRITLAVLVLIGLPLSIVALAHVGILWIGAISVIAAAGALVFRTTTSLTAKPKVFHAIITEHTLLLIDAHRQGAGPAVEHAYPRLTLADIRSYGGRLAMTSAGSPIKLLTDPGDARQMAMLLPAPPTP